MRIPKKIYIETTNKCNACCVMCPHELLKRPRIIMAEDLFKSIIDSLIGLDLSDTKFFLHKEGEPLMDPMLSKRIKYLKDNLFPIKSVILSTNAMLLNETVSKQLINSGLDTIYFSVDGATKKTYESIRRGCIYEIIEENIRNFFRIKQDLGSNIRVIMQMIICSENEHEKDMFIEKWKKYEPEFYIKKMHCYLDGKKSSFSNNLTEKQLNVCWDPFEMLVIYANGEVGCCCWDYNNEYSLGNIRNSSILELFNGNKINEMREAQMNKSCHSIVPCNRCQRIFGNDMITSQYE